MRKGGITVVTICNLEALPVSVVICGTPWVYVYIYMFDGALAIFNFCPFFLSFFRELEYFNRSLLLRSLAVYFVHYSTLSLRLH